MAARIELETFEAAETAPSPEIDPAEVEELKLGAFEQGYSAGWDDAIAAQDAEATRLAADLGRNLQDLSLTFQDARAHLLASLEPLLRDMVTKVLPALARDNLARIVLEQLLPVADAAVPTGVRVVAHPVSLPQIRALLSAGVTIPLEFCEEPSLGEAQVYLRFADSETRIDIDSVIEAIRAAITTYFSTSQQEAQNG